MNFHEGLFFLKKSYGLMRMWSIDLNTGKNGEMRELQIDRFPNF